MRVTQIPRQAVQFGLWGARLPLTLADRVLIRGLRTLLRGCRTSRSTRSKLA
jgi:hypothetical protein